MVAEVWWHAIRTITWLGGILGAAWGLLVALSLISYGVIVVDLLHLGRFNPYGSLEGWPWPEIGMLLVYGPGMGAVAGLVAGFGAALAAAAVIARWRRWQVLVPGGGEETVRRVSLRAAVVGAMGTILGLVLFGLVVRSAAIFTSAPGPEGVVMFVTAPAVAAGVVCWQVAASVVRDRAGDAR